MFLGGRLKAFGSMNSQLTTPTVKASDSVLTEVKLPSDERERDVTLAIAVGGSALFWLTLQVLQTS